MQEYWSQKTSVLNPSLGGVGVTGVQAGLCGCRCAVGSRWAVEGLCAPTQVLQGLQKGAACSLLFQWGGTLLFYLSDLSKGDWLGFEAGLPRSAGATLALRRTLGDGQLLGELLGSSGHQLG